jgi:4-hydroxythreonine-4-phosphate dehydrogenase
MGSWIGISLGDVTGIGPEVTLKALEAEGQADDTRYLIIGDAEHLEAMRQRLGVKLTLTPYGGPQTTGPVCVLDPLGQPLPVDLLEGSPMAARAALAWLREGASRCLRQELDALVTAPVNKHAIVRAGHAFIGQTS